MSKPLVGLVFFLPPLFPNITTSGRVKIHFIIFYLGYLPPFIEMDNISAGNLMSFSFFVPVDLIPYD